MKIFQLNNTNSLRHINQIFICLILCLGVSCGGSTDSNLDSRAIDKPNVIVIYTDDQGYADLGVQGVVADVKTPNIDHLALNGARFLQGYVTAPQCTPSRAAMVTGQYQQRIGIEDNSDAPISSMTQTLGHRFQTLGYKTGLVGKWHLGISRTSLNWAAAKYPDNVPFDPTKVPEAIKLSHLPANMGYEKVYSGVRNRYLHNYALDGQDKPLSYVLNRDYRLDVVNDAATTFIEQNWQQPFYLHVAHYGPHVPLEAPNVYLDRFPDNMPIRRKYALAMLSAIDDGVGRIIDILNDKNILDNTIIFFISDNGAPLGEDMTDAPISDDREAWNGSLNTPYVGEKGMLTEGGIRVPYIMHWPQKIATGKEINTPVSILDAAYTALKWSGDTNLNELDGMDLVPLLNDTETNISTRPLFWRFFAQKSVRKGKWKYLKAGLEREYLFDMSIEPVEQLNLIDVYPDVATSLRSEYKNWADTMLLPDKNDDISNGLKSRYDLYIP